MTTVLTNARIVTPDRVTVGTVVLDEATIAAVVAIIAGLYFAGQITGTAAIVLGIVAVAFLVTSLIGWCPTYVPFGISTKKKETTVP